MRHLGMITRAGAPMTAPAGAVSLLEKEAMTDLIQRNISQLAVLLNYITGIKTQFTE